MQEQVFKPIIAFVGTLSGILTFTNVLQGLGLFFGAMTALFSALYWFSQWRKSVDEHKWKKQDRDDG